MPALYDPDSLELSLHHLIDGRRVAGGGRALQTVRPSDGRVSGTLNIATADIVDAAVRGADHAFRNSGWAEAAPLERARVLTRWAELLDERRDMLARVESATTTRPCKDVVARDLVRASGAIRYFAQWCDKVEGSLLPSSAQATVLSRPEPYGVIASIAPFNFPAINAIWKSAPALAVGNAVVLKPSELTPFSALLIAEWAVEAGLPHGLFNVVLGDGETGSHLVRHPLVGKVSFTGSSRTGARVMADAAETGTKPVTLELGGKTPQLVLKDVQDTALVAEQVANGFLANAGQVCTAGTRLIAPNAILDTLVERIAGIAAARRPGPTWDEEATLPPIISGRQLERIEDMVARTEADGARILAGGTRSAGRNEGFYYDPTILADVPESSTGYRDEFFGPVLSVAGYDDEDEGIAMARHPSYGLAASVYTADLTKAMSLSARLEAGTVWVNCHGRQPDYSTPQGGFKGSGFGKEMGRAGLESFLRHKTIWINHG